MLMKNANIFAFEFLCIPMLTNEDRYPSSSICKKVPCRKSTNAGASGDGVRQPVPFTNCNSVISATRCWADIK